jgi:hypothetical protein
MVLSAGDRAQRVQQTNLTTEEQQVLAKCATYVQDEYEASLWRPDSTGCKGEANDATDVTPSFYRVGQVGIFVLESLESSVLKSMMGTLEIEEDLKVVIIACSHPTAYSHSAQNENDTGGSAQQDVAAFLNMLFQWKESKNKSDIAREALLLSGGTQIGMTSELRDSRSGLAIPEVIVSPTSGMIQAFKGPRAGDLGERFAFVHYPLEGQHVFCTVDIDLQTRSGRPSVDVHLMGVPTIRQATKSPIKSND